MSEDLVFETDGIQPEKYLWMWYCRNCYSTFPPFLSFKAKVCPDCGKEKLVKVKVEEV